jgi:prefoldin alpha subunit
VEFVKENLERLQETIQKKQDNVNVVVNIMQAKMRGQPSAT